MKRFLISSVATAVLLATSVVPAFAAAPVRPNCLGTDVSGFAQNLKPLGQNVVTNFTSGGFGTEILAHLQGIPTISNCPDGGFPTPYPLP